jgi:hypothetical protein
MIITRVAERSASTAASQTEDREPVMRRQIMEELRRITVADGITEQDLITALRNFGPTILRYSFGGYA